MKMRLFDAHCDTAFELWQREEGLEENTCHISLKNAEKFDSYAQIFAFCSLAGLNIRHSAEELLSRPLAKLRQEVDKNSHRIAFAKTGSEVAALNGQGKIAALLSIEGPEVIACDPERLYGLREEGFVMSTLTWNADNALAGWHGGERGLTDLGRAFVRTAESIGIYIDVSHLSERSFWDLAKIAEKPIVASHSNCGRIWNHSRNLTDDQLRVIAQSGGVVGLNLYVPFLGKSADFETLQMHLEHMLQICGEKSVCLGGDLDGCDELPKGFHNLTNYNDFHQYLQSKGFPEELLDRIFYQNLFRLF